MQNQSIEVKPVPDERIDYIDFLRVIALFMVVMIHVSAFYFFGEAVSSKTWMVAHFYDSLSRPAVPIFIMVSGMLLLSSNRPSTLSSFLRNRSFRVIVPLFVWTIIYIVWSAIKVNEPINLKEFFPNFLSGNVYYHLYFLYIIFGLYLITPLLKVFIAQAKKQDFIYAIALWILAVSVFPLLDKFFGIKIYYLLIPITGYVGYFISGYFLSTIPRVNNLLLFIIWLIANLVTYFGTWMISIKTGDLDQFFYGYTSLSVIASAFTLFIYIKQINFSNFYTRHPHIKRFISLSSSMSFSIYLIHLLILEMLYTGTFGVAINSHTFNSYFGILIISSIVVVISGLIVFVLRRLPVIRWLLP